MTRLEYKLIKNNLIKNLFVNLSTYLDEFKRENEFIEERKKNVAPCL